MEFSKLALSGILGAGLAIGAGCGGSESATEPAAEETPATTEAAPKADKADKADKAGKGGKGKAGKTAAAAGDTYSEIHDCAGKNSCKGLGGCKVSESKLTKLADAAGTSADDMGEPHDCSGLNACKGLGGCGVDEKKLAELKAKLEG